jgi:nucleoside phosphorylase
MLIIFAAFKKEAENLLKLINCQKIIKDSNTIIYIGKIRNKKIIVCITGMGKSNSLNGASKIIQMINQMKLDNPVFLIQGISGALVENLKIGDLVVYESIQNLEQFQISRQIKEKKYDMEKTDNNKGLSNQNTEKDIPDEDDKEEEFNKIWGLPYNSRLTKNEISKLSKYFNVFNREEIQTVTEINNKNFDFLKNVNKNLRGNYNISRVPAALVSDVIRDYKDKKALNKLFGVEAVDMESYYIADIAQKNNIPVICIRAISDDLFESVPDYFSGSDFEESTKKSYIKTSANHKMIKYFNKAYKLSGMLFKIIFSKSEIKAILKTLKNINIACKNLNNFVIEMVLPYFDYK